MEKEAEIYRENGENEQVMINIEEINLNDTPADKLECLYCIEKLVFLFVNPKSGSEEGLLFFEVANKYTCSKVKDDNRLFKFEDKEESFYLYMFDILKQNEYQKGCKLVEEYIHKLKNKTDKVKILVAGGDGTVLSIIEHLSMLNLDINRCVFGHVPLGTGNDLSNALGFGSDTEISKDISSLKRVLMKYYRARTSKVDVWELKLNVHEEGGEIVEIRQDDKTPKIDKDGRLLTSYKRSFINYFSLGYDARVGFGFEKSRSGSRCWNKCIYFWEGCKKNCCRKTLKLNSFIESFQVVDMEQKDEHNEVEHNPIKNNDLDHIVEIKDQHNINDNNVKDYNRIMNQKSECLDNSNAIESIAKTKGKTLFRSRLSLNIGPNEQDYKDIVLKGDPVSIVCQNINFYMGGTKDIWKKSEKIGLEVIENEKTSKKETKNLEHMFENCRQSYNDQKLEFFTYASGLKVGFEKIAAGQADRIFQGSGPIIIKFKETPERNKSDKFNRVYINIDGEYYNIVRPVQIMVKLNKRLCGGSVNFLINN